MRHVLGVALPVVFVTLAVFVLHADAVTSVPNAPTALDWNDGPIVTCRPSGGTCPSGPLDLKWKDNSTDEDGFRLKRQTDGSVVATYPADSELGDLPFLDPQTDWCRQMGLMLVAYNEAGESEPSNVLHLYPLPSGCKDTW
jgi:hypothetical protein